MLLGKHLTEQESFDLGGKIRSNNSQESSRRKPSGGNYAHQNRFVRHTGRYNGWRAIFNSQQARKIQRRWKAYITRKKVVGTGIVLFQACVRGATVRRLLMKALGREGGGDGFGDDDGFGGGRGDGFDMPLLSDRDEGGHEVDKFLKELDMNMQKDMELYGEFVKGSQQKSAQSRPESDQQDTNPFLGKAKVPKLWSSSTSPSSPQKPKPKTSTFSYPGRDTSAYSYSGSGDTSARDTFQGENDPEQEQDGDENSRRFENPDSPLAYGTSKGQGQGNGQGQSTHAWQHHSDFENTNTNNDHDYDYAGTARSMNSTASSSNQFSDADTYRGEGRGGGGGGAEKGMLPGRERENASMPRGRDNSSKGNKNSDSKRKKMMADPKLRYRKLITQLRDGHSFGNKNSGGDRSARSPASTVSDSATRQQPKGVAGTPSPRKRNLFMIKKSRRKGNTKHKGGGVSHSRIMRDRSSHSSKRFGRSTLPAWMKGRGGGSAGSEASATSSNSSPTMDEEVVRFPPIINK